MFFRPSNMSCSFDLFFCRDYGLFGDGHGGCRGERTKNLARSDSITSVTPFFYSRVVIHNTAI